MKSILKSIQLLKSQIHDIYVQFYNSSTDSANVHEAIIDIRTFTSIKSLSKYILYLNENEEEYNKYFEFHNKDGDFLISDVELTTEETKTYKFLYNQENNILMDRSGSF